MWMCCLFSWIEIVLICDKCVYGFTSDSDHPFRNQFGPYVRVGHWPIKISSWWRSFWPIHFIPSRQHCFDHSTARYRGRWVRETGTRTTIKSLSTRSFEQTSPHRFPINSRLRRCFVHYWRSPKARGTVINRPMSSRSGCSRSGVPEF